LCGKGTKTNDQSPAQVVRLSEIRECSRDSDCLASAKFSKAWGAAPVHPPTLAVVCSAVLAASGSVALTGAAGLELLKPAANDVLQCWPVSRRVNSSRAPDDDPTLIEAVAVGAGGDVQQMLV
jgi:hypothetical protein